MNRNSMLRRKSYWLKKMQVELYNEMLDFVKANELSQKDIAERLGVSKGYVSKLFNGKIDHKLSKVVDLAFLMDKVPIINYPQLKNYEDKEERGVMLPYKTFEYYCLKNPNQLKDERSVDKPSFHLEHLIEGMGYNMPTQLRQEDQASFNHYV